MVTIDQIIADKIDNWYIGEWPIGNFLLCFIALLLSVVLCGAIGYERERRGRSAGLRTHLLVGVGSCIIMIISIYGFPSIFHGTDIFERDVARLAAQVITGVGFLGAGAIIHRNSGTKGLTTAATIWIVMAIGLACGSMNFILATGGTILIIIVLTLFRKIEERINQKTPMIIMHAEKDKPIVSNILTVCQKYDCKPSQLSTEFTDDGDIEIIFIANIDRNSFNNQDLVKSLEEIDGVKQVNILSKSK